MAITRNGTDGPDSLVGSGNPLGYVIYDSQQQLDYSSQGYDYSYENGYWFLTESFNGGLSNDTISPNFSVSRGVYSSSYNNNYYYYDYVDGGLAEDLLVLDYSVAQPIAGPGGTTLAVGAVTNSSGYIGQKLGSNNSVLVNSVSYSNIERFSITGTNFNDYLDFRYDATGNSTLSGLGGDDTLYSGSGNDAIEGGIGKDIIDAGQGNDIINAGDGDDYVRVTTPYYYYSNEDLKKNDQLDGGVGIDTVSVDLSNQTVNITFDNLNPGTGVTFADGTKVVNFEVFEDISTGDGADYLKQTGSIDNYFDAGRNNDTIAPGLGKDDYVDGDLGTDLLILDYSGVSDQIPVKGVSSQFIQEKFSILTAQIETVNKVAISNIESYQITATNYNDSLDVYSSTGNSTLAGLAGDDTLYTGSGDDSIEGGIGNDIIESTTGNDTINAGDGNDYVYVTTPYRSSSSQDPKKNDQLDGGTGIDTVSVDLSNQTVNITFDDLNPGTGITFADGTKVVNFEVFEDIATGDGSDYIRQTGSINNSFKTGRNNDTIAPGLGKDDYVDGGEGIDLLVLDYSSVTGDTLGVSNSGSGYFYYGQWYYSSSTSISQKKYDQLSQTTISVNQVSQYNIEAYQITATPYNDTLNFNGATGDSTLIGGAGDDTLSTGSGNDLIDGGTGSNKLKGGTGNDTYIQDGITGAGSRIEDIGGTDNLTLSGVTLALQPLATGVSGLGRIGNNLIIDLDKNGIAETAKDITVVDFYNATGGSGTGFIETINNISGQELLSATKPPTTLSLSPLDNALAVGATDNLIINFDENVQAGVGNVLIKKMIDNSVVETINISSPQVIFNGTQVTIDPSVILTENTSYYVEITSGAIKDLTGNNYDGFTGNTVWNFTTSVANDNFANRIVLIGVPVTTTGSNISATSEAGEPAQSIPNNSVWWSWTAPSDGIFVVDTKTSNFDTFLAIYTGSSVDSLNLIGSDDQSGGNSTSLINLTATAGTTYQIAVDGWSTYTGNIALNIAPETTPPFTTNFNPVDDATVVPTDSNLVLTFSEAVKRGTGDIFLKQLSDNTLVPSTFIISGNQLIIDPVENLAYNTGYYVEIANNAIQDIAGNNYAGITGNTVWNFTTVLPSDITPPSITGLTPSLGSIQVDIATDLVTNFNEPIQKGIGSISIKKFTDNSIVETIDVTSPNVTVVGNQLTVNPTNNLVAGTDYYVEIGSGAITDSVGNASVGISGNITWKFSTYPTPTTANDLLIGTENADTIDGLAGNDNISGLAGNDSLIGSEGDDSIDGGAGDDTMVGGVGNDTYTVGGTNDKVVEALNAGQDLIRSSVTYTLPTNVENLVLTGTGNIKGTGNTLNNSITGNAGKNNLSGGTGADSLIGGAGDDTYTVDNTGDKVTENTSAGKDLIRSSVNYTLPSNVENLVLTGTGNINGTGNTLNNRITGNAGKNNLSGSTGTDSLIGGAGDDTYTVDNTGDKVTEKASAGKDLINSSVTYTLPANVENLTLTGTGNINGSGNSSGNTITGNSGKNSLSGSGGADTLNGGAGDDTLNGGAGNDRLIAGTGADRFLYSTNAVFATSSVGVDTITDFIISQNDRIVLDKTTFPKITSSNGTGFSKNAEFAEVSTDAAAATSAAFIVYNTETGSLFYNQNGAATGFGTGAKFAVLTNKPALTENQFMIQA